MIKIQHLLLTLLVASSVKAYDLSNTGYNPLESTYQNQEKSIPSRIQNLLDKKKDKFTQIEHYYTWVTRPFTTLEAIGHATVSLGLSTLSIVGSGYILFYENWHILARLLPVFLGVFILLPVAVLVGVMGKLSYEDSIHPGCFCLTDKGLIIIPTGGGDECVWIPYQNILFIRKYTMPSDPSIDQLVTTQQSKNRIKYMLEEANAKKEIDSQNLCDILNAMSESSHVSNNQGGSGQLWIVFEQKRKYSLNTYCNSEYFTSLDEYEELFRELRKKHNAYLKKEKLKLKDIEKTKDSSVRKEA